jgi:HK97 family phage portal protein
VRLAQAGVLREIPNHPLLKILTRPNEHLTGRASLELSQQWIDIKGEAFWLLNTGSAGEPTGYMPIPPHWVISVPSATDKNYRIAHGLTSILVPQEKMIWLKKPDPENPYGRGSGVGEALADEIETDEVASKFVKSWFQNNGNPSAIVSYEGATQTQIEQLEVKFEQKHLGPSRQNKLHFSGGKMNFQRLDTSFKDQQVSELRKWERDTIVHVFGVPPETVGIIENSNRATIDGAAYMMAVGVIQPRIEFLRSEIQHRLAPLFDANISIECEIKVPEDVARKDGIMKAQPVAFALNEWRAAAGYDPIPEFEGRFPMALPGQLPSADPALAKNQLGFSIEKQDPQWAMELAEKI